MLGLLDAVIDRLADILELVGARLDALSTRIFDTHAETPPLGVPHKERRMKSSELQEVLSSLGRTGELNHKVRSNLAALERLVTFLGPIMVGRFSKDQKASLKTLARDISSLVQQSGFLAQEANFLLDATLGLINVEQSHIIKIFSVAAVAFLPPTLIASIYGMNFDFMPELGWPLGYPLALLMMAVSALVPLWYFRRRGWL
jgi:magnesium transporter